jgi:hypothetical protein
VFQKNITDRPKAGSRRSQREKQGSTTPASSRPGQDITSTPRTPPNGSRCLWPRLSVPPTRRNVRRARCSQGSKERAGRVAGTRYHSPSPTERGKHHVPLRPETLTDIPAPHASRGASQEDAGSPPSLGSPRPLPAVARQEGLRVPSAPAHETLTCVQ